MQESINTVENNKANNNANNGNVNNGNVNSKPQSLVETMKEGVHEGPSLNQRQVQASKLGSRLITAFTVVGSTIAPKLPKIIRMSTCEDLLKDLNRAIKLCRHLEASTEKQAPSIRQDILAVIYDADATLNMYREAQYITVKQHAAVAEHIGAAIVMVKNK
jgi:hypothetical protein